MSLSFQVENSRLQCPSCKYPITGNSAAATKVLCPRCNTWLDIDPSCSGSCVACHKTASKAPQSPCVETFLENSPQKCSEEEEIGVRIRLGSESINENKSKTLSDKLRFLAAKARTFLSG